jgi:hypothetical protein
MAYHIYVKPDGFASIVGYQLDLTLPPFAGYRYLGDSDVKPDIDGKKYINGGWGWGGSEPQYVQQRREAYPRTPELIQALWQAMDAGILPKVEGFYDKIKEVNDRFPPI